MVNFSLLMLKLHVLKENIAPYFWGQKQKKINSYIKLRFYSLILVILAKVIMDIKNNNNDTNSKISFRETKIKKCIYDLK